jgi:hypothetical protein
MGIINAQAEMKSINVLMEFGLGLLIVGLMIMFAI